MTRVKAIQILNKIFDGYLIMEKVCSAAIGEFNDDQLIRYRLDEITDKKIALLTAVDSLKAEPVKHGRWIIDYAEGSEIYHAHCSECNNEPDRNIGGDYYIDKLSDYCPNCGAKMDGDNNG